MGQPPRIAPKAVAHLHQKSQAAAWGLSVDLFRNALEASVAHAFSGRDAAASDVDRYLESLHISDLALACACAAGSDTAWDHFVLQFRPALYRAADAIDPTGRTRETADALYADLYGLKERDGERQSLFRYFHGRCSLATWLRAVLSQRHIDAIRTGRRLEPLPEEHEEAPVPAAGARGSGGGTGPAGDRARFLTLMRRALAAAVAALAPRDRLRLASYYIHDLTLAQIGRTLREHEATVSRHLSRTRKELRVAIEQSLASGHGLDQAAIAECFRSVMDDAGDLDLRELVGAGERKKSARDRSV